MIHPAYEIEEIEEETIEKYPKRLEEPQEEEE